MYIPHIKMKDGYCNIAWIVMGSPILWSLEEGFWKVINRLSMMDYIDNKYYGGTLELLNIVDKKIST